jgi:putative oxidoreductase
MQNPFTVRQLPLKIDLVLLLIRLVVGVAFLYHGWGKIQHPFSWMGAQATVPAFFQFLAAISEFGGGLAILVGFLTRLGALGLFFTMSYAVYTVAILMHAPFVASGFGPSAEPAATYLVLSLLLVVMGPGRFSLDRLFFGKR